MATQQRHETTQYRSDIFIVSAVYLTAEIQKWLQNSRFSEAAKIQSSVPWTKVNLVSEFPDFFNNITTDTSNNKQIQLFTALLRVRKNNIN